MFLVHVQYRVKQMLYITELPPCDVAIVKDMHRHNSPTSPDVSNCRFFNMSMCSQPKLSAQCGPVNIRPGPLYILNVTR